MPIKGILYLIKLFFEFDFYKLSINQNLFKLYSIDILLQLLSFVSIELSYVEHVTFLIAR